MRKILFRGAIAIVLLVVVVLVGGYLWLRSSLPTLDGEVRASGLTAPVEVVRDRHAIPHIYADSFEDAAFAMGFVHAQDRLWQMEMNRRIGAGRLSEVLGQPTVDFDRFLRMLGLYRHAEAGFAKLSPETKRVYSAYAAGVNAYLEQRTGPLPPEFLILGVEPEPWSPADSLVFLKVMALNLSGNWSRELTRLRLTKRLTAAQIEDFYPSYGSEMPHGVLANYGFADLIDTAALDRMIEALPAPPAEGIGSNNWVVDGQRTKSGKPLLANDPHLGLTAPAIWYFAHMSWGNRNLIGASLPGVPLIILGRSDRMAWGFTNGQPDVQDLYIEKVDPTDSNRYLTPSGTEPFKTRREVIKVKDQDDIELIVRETRHGPVLSDVHRGAQSTLPDGHVLALAWTALSDDDLTPQAGVRLSQVDDWDGFVDALRDYHVPQQNIVYADVDGNVGYYAPARVPVRDPENPIQGYMPQPGWDPLYDWRGTIPFEELPQAFNPDGGMIATANHRNVAVDYPHHLTFDWAAGYRARRINGLLSETSAHSAESFQSMQADTVSLFAVDVLPYLTAIAPSGAQAKAALDLMSAWNGDMVADRPEPLIFQAWIRKFSKLVTEDELGDLQALSWGRKGPFLHRVLSQRQKWCDDTRTEPTETCAQMLERALDEALDWISERQGSDMADWQWGQEHIAIGAHRPFSRVPVLRDFFDINGPVPGSTYTVNVGDFRIFNSDRPFASVHGPGLRAVYDLADPEKSLFIHSTGQSGNPLSPYYSSFAEKWRRVEYIPMVTDRAAIAEQAIGTLMLNPASR